jgi:pyridoxamine 5'-phosphate oxidase
VVLHSAIANFRKEYQLESLLESTVDPDPYRQFQLWFDQVVAAELPEPNAMTLATATPDGIPSARIVLLKGVDPQGFVFFTNYTSQKGAELAANPRAAIVFLWVELERQVRIQGSVVKLPDAESDDYFRSRPLGSQLGAWVSEQSQVIPDRESLEQRLADLQQQYANQPIPRPPHWGGYRLQPTSIEFWQGRRNRLHDRLCYRLVNGEWVIERLAP